MPPSPIRGDEPERPRELDSEDRFAALETRLVAFEWRLAALESAAAARPEPGPALHSEPSIASGFAAGPWVAAAGRALLVFGGATLLRALTDEGLVRPLLGLTAGLGYVALVYLAAAHAAAAGRRPFAYAAGLAAVAIVYPLLLEGVTRFAILGPLAAAALVLVALEAGLAVAGRHRLTLLAWAATLGALVVALALLLVTRRLVLFAGLLLAVSLRVELEALAGRWSALRWPASVAADAAVAVMLLVALRPGGVPASYAPLSLTAVAAICLALALSSFGAAALGSLWRARPLGPFDVVQTCVALALGLGGAVRTLRVAGESVALVGLVGLALGLVCYLAGFLVIERRAGRHGSFYAYTTLGALLAIAGSALALAGGPLAAAWSSLALLAAALAGRHGRITLRYHALVLLAGAGAASGLLPFALVALFGRAPGVPPIGPSAVAVLAAMAVAYRLQGPGTGAALGARVLLAALTVFGFAGAVAAGLTLALGIEADPGWRASVRTAVLSALGLGLGFGGRGPVGRELGLLLYPVLAVTALKLLADDLPSGRPATLVLGLALYGGALLVAPRLAGARSEREG